MEHNISPILRFGISADGKRSAYWRIRAGVAKPELFMEREDQGDRWHFSLHASGQWHMKREGQVRARWTRPPETEPGYTRAVGIVQPAVVARRDVPAPEGVEFTYVVLDAEPTTFSVFLERPGADEKTWPGKNAAGTKLVGRIRLAAGAGTCCVVALQEPLPPGQLNISRPSPEELEHMKKSAAAENLVATVIGTFSDGAIALIDLLADRNLISTSQTVAPAT